MATLPPRQHGTTLIEVLVTVLILAFGLLGIAAFQAKAQVGSIESYQRAQAVVLLEDMTARITTNSAAAADYVSSDIHGTGDGQPADCSTLTTPTIAERDLCEWSNALKGSAEKSASDANVGAMTGARGCITELQAPDDTVGVCTPAIYQVAVAWQGLHPTVAPAITCARGSGAYGSDDTYRRAIAVRVAVGLPSCK